MANEAVCIETPQKFGRYTVADGTAIPYGTLVYLSADGTVSATSAADQSFEGIVWVAKAASNGVTEVSVALDGVWDLTDDGAGIALGVLCAIGGANLIQTADATDILNGAVVGYTEEAASASEVIRVRITKFGSSGN